MRRVQALALSAAMVLALAVGAPKPVAAQSMLDDPSRTLMGPPPGMSMSRFGMYRRRLSMLRNTQRKQKMTQDADRLLRLAETYRSSLADVAPEAEASRQLDEIAKLAHDVQQSMRN